MKEYTPIIIKKINELYFRHYQDTDFYMLKSDYNIQDIMSLMKIGARIKDTELTNLLKDLYFITLNDTSFHIGYSSLMQGILNTVQEMSRAFDVIELPQDVLNVLSYSKESYLVGGAVRDTLMGKEPKDFDFVTDIDYDTMEKLFTEAGFNVKETGKQFLVMIVSKDGNDYEIANFRKDGTYSDGRRPESVQIGNIYDDSSRRDFCINSLYYSLSEKVVKDPTGMGIEDIKSKTLRFVGKPEDRIADDKLRVFRFYRFLSKGFSPDPKSLSAVRKCFDSACKTTTPERIKNEIEKIVL